MRRKISLYIADQLVDLDDQSFILFNYLIDDMGNPTIVRNSFSQAITLKGTPANNKIFGGMWRSDRLTQSGATGHGINFDAARKTSFAIYNEMGEILESGYCKLDRVTRNRGLVEYQVSLFGDLGSFFYGLAYDSEGNRRTLADLALLPPTVDQNSGLTVGYYVDAQGRVLPSPTACFGCMVAVSPGDVVRIKNDGYLWMISAYHNGVIVPEKSTNGLYSWTVPDGINGVIITYRNSEPDKTLIITRAGAAEELEFEITRAAVSQAWERLRGDDKQPNLWDIINFAPAYNGLPTGLFDADKALFDTVASGVSIPDGYSSRGGRIALASLPKEYTEWETQDLRSYMQRPVIKMSKVIEAICQSYNNGGYEVDLDSTFFTASNPYWDKTWLTLPLINSLDVQITEGSGQLTIGSDFRIPGGGNPSTSYQVTVALRPKITVSGEGSTTEYDLHCDDTYESEGVTYNGHYMNYITYIGRAYDSSNNVIQERVIRVSSRQTAGEGNVPQIDFIGYFDSSGLWYGDNVTLEFTALGISYIRVTRETTAAGWGSLRFALDANKAWSDPASYEPNYAISAWGVDTPAADNVYSYTTSDSARSGVTITKRMLLSSDKTPADYLISFCKMFGLVFLIDKGARKVSIMRRQTFYQDNVIDLTERVDISRPAPVLPFSYDCKWYDFSLPYGNGEYAKYYANIYDRIFGIQRVNTGYGFNAESKNLLEGIAFKGACEVLEASKYFVNLSNGSLRIPAVFQDSGGTFTVLDRTGKAEDIDIPLPSSQVYRGWWNPDNKTYDFISKPQFHNAGNAAYEERDTLLFFDGVFDIAAITTRIGLSDDTALMMALNDNTPCWILDPATVGGYSPVRYLPRFSRYIMSDGVITKSLDFGTPGEVAIPDITFASDSSIYSQFWRRYISDRYDDDSRVMTCRVNLSGLRVNESLLRSFFFYDNAIWALRKITNHSMTTWDATECEFIKVQDTTNYLN